MFLFSNIRIGSSNLPNQKLDDVVKTYYMDIYIYCTSRLSINKSYAGDITQEVFKLLYEKSKTTKIDNYRAWIYKTANNLLKNFYKTHKRKTEKETYIDDMPEPLSYEQNFEMIDEDTIEQYKDEILNSLTKQECELFTMNNIEKLSRAQISERLSIPENTVKQRLYRLNQKIKDEARKKLEQMK